MYFVQLLGTNIKSSNEHSSCHFHELDYLWVRIPGTRRLLICTGHISFSFFIFVLELSKRKKKRLGRASGQYTLVLVGKYNCIHCCKSSEQSMLFLRARNLTSINLIMNDSAQWKKFSNPMHWTGYENKSKAKMQNHPWSLGKLQNHSKFHFFLITSISSYERINKKKKKKLLWAEKTCEHHVISD